MDATPDDSQIRAAADALRDTIAMKTGELADALLGRPKFGTDEWKADREAQGTPEGEAKLLEWHLTKIRICHAAQVDSVGNVLNARRLGATWQQIGSACGITRQAAHDRWARYETDDSPYMDPYRDRDANYEETEPIDLADLS